MTITFLIDRWTSSSLPSLQSSAPLSVVPSSSHHRRRRRHLHYRRSRCRPHHVIAHAQVADPHWSARAPARPLRCAGKFPSQTAIAAASAAPRQQALSNEFCQTSCRWEGGMFERALERTVSGSAKVNSPFWKDIDSTPLSPPGYPVALAMCNLHIGTLVHAFHPMICTSPSEPAIPPSSPAKKHNARTSSYL